MTIRALAASTALLVIVGLAPMAAASSLPKVDFGQKPSFGVGVGASQSLRTGGSLSIDVPLYNVFLLGGSLASNIDGSLNFDTRLLYRFIEGGKEGPTIAGMIGVWGAPGNANFRLPAAMAPMVGFGLAYPVLDKVDVRLNLAYSPFYNYEGNEFLTFIGGPPSSGAEVGYQVTPNMEVTVGINGRGDFLGANITF